MRVRLHPAVDFDLLEIMEYYKEAADSDLAAEFYVEFRHYADKIGGRTAVVSSVHS